MFDFFRVENLYFGYTKKPFLKNICFDVHEGEMISVIGENGSGKSTLFKIINGIIKNYIGKISYKNNNIKSLSYMEKAREIAILYQNCNCNFPFTCFEVVSMGLYPNNYNFYKLRKENIDFVTHIMEITDTIQLAHKNINCISGGQLQRVLIAKALVQKPKLLFLDEAMSGLDISAKIKMIDIILKECHENGMTVLNILHDINMAFQKSDKIIALKNGEVYSFGKPRDLLNKDFFREVFNVEVDIDNDKKYFRIIL